MLNYSALIFIGITVRFWVAILVSFLKNSFLFTNIRLTVCPAASLIVPSDEEENRKNFYVENVTVN